MQQLKKSSFTKTIENLISIIENIKHKNCFAAIGILVFTFYAFTQRWFALYLEVRAYQVLIVSLALLLIIIGVFTRDYFKKKLTTVDLAWLFAIIVILINILLIEHISKLMDLFLFTAVFLFLVFTKVNIRSFFPTLTFIAGSAVIYALGSIVQYLFNESFNRFIFNYTTTYSQESIVDLNRRRYFPGLGFSRTAVAPGYMAAGFGVLISFWDNNKNNLIKIFFGLALIILIIGLIVAAKRSIFLWVLVAMPITYFALGVGFEKWKRAFKMFGVAILLIAIMLLLLQMPELPPFLQRMESLFGRLLAGDFIHFLGLRYVHYEDAWSRFINEPIFGIGWKQFELLHEHETHVHNFVLQLLTEIGIVGFIVVKSAFIYTLIKTYQSLQSIMRRASEVDLSWRCGLTFSLYYQVFFLLFGVFGNPFNEETFIMVYFIAVSISNSYLVSDSYKLQVEAEN